MGKYLILALLAVLLAGCGAKPDDSCGTYSGCDPTVAAHWDNEPMCRSINDWRTEYDTLKVTADKIGSDQPGTYDYDMLTQMKDDILNPFYTKCGMSTLP